jgi:hypothetical protein
VNAVEANVEIIVEITDDATGNRYRHSENVDENVKLVLKEIPEGNEKVVL